MGVGSGEVIRDTAIAGQVKPESKERITVE